MGTYKKMQGMVSQYDPPSAKVASDLLQKTKDAGQGISQAGKTLIDQMAMELQGHRTTQEPFGSSTRQKNLE